MIGQVLCNGNCDKSIGVKQRYVPASALFYLPSVQFLHYYVCTLDIVQTALLQLPNDSLLETRHWTSSLQKPYLQMTLIVHKVNHLQLIGDCLAETSMLFGLNISLKKTEVLVQLAPKAIYLQPKVTIKEV